MPQVSTKVRFLVLSSGNEVINPSDVAEDGALDVASLDLDLQSEGSPSHNTKESAIKFASALAAASVGKRFYVAAILGGTMTSAPVAPAANWRDAIPSAE